jgi:hypothetical protein
MNCQGSHHAERAAIEAAHKAGQVEVVDEMATEGVIGHGWVAAKTTGDEIGARALWLTLKAWTQQLAETAYRRRIKLLDDFLPGWNTQENPAHVIVERRLWIGTASGTKIASGQHDLFAHRGGKVVIEDTKIGPMAVDDADVNLQLRVLAVCAKQAVDPDECIVAINQPACGEQVPALFTKEELRVAEMDIIAGAKAAMRKSAPRTAGAWCVNCKANGRCQEGIDYVNATKALVVGTPEVELTKSGVAEIVAVTSPEVCKQVWQKRREVSWILDAITSRLKALPADELTALGLRLKPGKNDPSYKDLDQLYQSLDLTFPEFLSCVTLSKGRMTELYQKKLGISEAKAKAQVEIMLSEFTVEGRMAEELAEIK